MPNKNKNDKNVKKPYLKIAAWILGIIIIAIITCGIIAWVNRPSIKDLRANVETYCAPEQVFKTGEQKCKMHKKALARRIKKYMQQERKMVGKKVSEFKKIAKAQKKACDDAGLKKWGMDNCEKLTLEMEQAAEVVAKVTEARDKNVSMTK